MAGVPEVNVNIMNVAELPLCVSSLSSTSEMIEMLNEKEVKEYVIMLEGKNGRFPTNYPKELKAELGNRIPHSSEINFIRLTRQGKLLVVTNSKECAREILAIQSILNIEVDVKVLFENLTTRFLLFNIPVSLSLAEVATEIEEVNNFKIKEIRRFAKNVGGKKIPTETILVTKLGTSLPTHVKLFFTRHQIRLFVDRPRQCQKCYRFEHNTQNCKYNNRCERCGEEHTTEACNCATIKCAGCNGGHMASDKQCPLWTKETKILRYKAENHVSFAEARRNFKSNPDSFASKASLPNVKVDTKQITEIIQEQLAEIKNSFQQALAEQAEAFKKMMTESLQMITQVIKEFVKEMIDIRQPTKRSKSSVAENSMELSLDELPLPDKLDFIKRGGRKAALQSSRGGS